MKPGKRKPKKGKAAGKKKRTGKQSISAADTTRPGDAPASKSARHAKTKTPTDNIRDRKPNMDFWDGESEWRLWEIGADLKAAVLYEAARDWLRANPEMATVGGLGVHRGDAPWLKLSPKLKALHVTFAESNDDFETRLNAPPMLRLVPDDAVRWESAADDKKTTEFLAGVRKTAEKNGDSPTEIEARMKRARQNALRLKFERQMPEEIVLPPANVKACMSGAGETVAFQLAVNFEYSPAKLARAFQSAMEAFAKATGRDANQSAQGNEKWAKNLKTLAVARYWREAKHKGFTAIQAAANWSGSKVSVPADWAADERRLIESGAALADLLKRHFPTREISFGTTG